MCKKCSRPVIWKRSVAGTEIELDAEPTPRVVLLASALCELVQTYSLHQDTCPAQNGHPKHRRRVSARVKP
jgi:hypothetical protein